MTKEECYISRQNILYLDNINKRRLSKVNLGLPVVVKLTVVVVMVS